MNHVLTQDSVYMPCANMYTTQFQANTHLGLENIGQIYIIMTNNYVLFSRFH